MPNDIKVHMPKQVSIALASRIWEIPEWTLRSYVSKRIIPFRRVGRKIYIPTDKMEAWLATGDVDPIDGNGGRK